MGADGRSAIAGLLLAAVAAITAQAQEAAPSVTGIIGIEQGAPLSTVQDAIRVIAERQSSLDAALREMDRRIALLAEASNATTAMLARGEDPLVSLEIEQLWKVISGLEQENARLRERLDTME